MSDVSHSKSFFVSNPSQAAVSPVEGTDYYGSGFETMKNEARFKGARNMSFGGIQTDKDRLELIKQFNSTIDTA